MWRARFGFRFGWRILRVRVVEKRREDETRRDNETRRDETTRRDKTRWALLQTTNENRTPDKTRQDKTAQKLREGNTNTRQDKTMFSLRSRRRCEFFSSTSTLLVDSVLMVSRYFCSAMEGCGVVRSDKDTKRQTHTHNNTKTTRHDLFYNTMVSSWKWKWEDNHETRRRQASRDKDGNDWIRTKEQDTSFLPSDLFLSHASQLSLHNDHFFVQIVDGVPGLFFWFRHVRRQVVMWSSTCISRRRQQLATAKTVTPLQVASCDLLSLASSPPRAIFGGRLPTGGVPRLCGDGTALDKRQRRLYRQSIWQNNDDNNDKTREDETRCEKTREEKRRQDETRQEKRGKKDKRRENKDAAPLSLVRIPSAPLYSQRTKAEIKTQTKTKTKTKTKRPRPRPRPRLDHD